MNIHDAVKHVLSGGTVEIGGKTLARLIPRDNARVKEPYVVTKNEDDQLVVFFPTDEEWNATDYVNPFYVAPPVIPITVEMTPAEHEAYLAWKTSNESIAESL